MPLRRSLCLGSQFLILGCDPPSSTPEEPASSEAPRYRREGDMYIPIGGGRNRSPLYGGSQPQLVYVNFDGATISFGPDSPNNAQTNTSHIIGKSQAVIPPFSHSYWGTNRQQVINTLLGHLRSDWDAATDTMSWR